jgi:hypothetical protein
MQDAVRPSKKETVSRQNKQMERTNGLDPLPELQTLLQHCHIRDVCTTAKNPQSNDVRVRMHQTVGNVIRTLLHDNHPQNIANAKQYVDAALSIAMHAKRAGAHSTLGSSPGNLVINRDMFLNIADWHTIIQ